MKSIKACKKDIKWCDAYKQGEAQAKAQLRTWPLISALHHPSMRQRHWEALMEKTQRNFTRRTKSLRSSWASACAWPARVRG